LDGLYDFTSALRDETIFDYLQVSEKMKMQDIWFLFLISVIVAHLRLVEDIQGFKTAEKIDNLTNIF
jgi:hypothetical protein